MDMTLLSIREYIVGFSLQIGSLHCLFLFDLRHYGLPLWYLQTFLAAGRQTAINQSAISTTTRIDLLHVNGCSKRFVTL
jgi:hypothetical protein